MNKKFNRLVIICVCFFAVTIALSVVMIAISTSSPSASISSHSDVLGIAVDVEENDAGYLLKIQEDHE